MTKKPKVPRRTTTTTPLVGVGAPANSSIKETVVRNRKGDVKKSVIKNSYDPYYKKVVKNGETKVRNTARGAALDTRYAIADAASAVGRGVKNTVKAVVGKGPGAPERREARQDRRTTRVEGRSERADIRQDRAATKVANKAADKAARQEGRWNKQVRKEEVLGPVKDAKAERTALVLRGGKNPSSVSTTTNVNSNNQTTKVQANPLSGSKSDSTGGSSNSSSDAQGGSSSSRSNSSISKRLKKVGGKFVDLSKEKHGGAIKRRK